MKKFLLGLLAVISLGAQARSAESDQEYCAGYARIAAKVMEFRQLGGSMSDLLASKKSDEIKFLADELIVEAFSKPRFQSEKSQQAAIVDFSNDTHVFCLNAMKKKR